MRSRVCRDLADPPTSTREPPSPLLSRESINLSSHLPSVANEETKVEKEGDEISLEIQRDRAIASDQITSNRDVKIVRNKSVQFA